MSLLKKFYPRSPEPLIGKRIGDNYVAKLAQLNELIDAIEELYANTPPGSGLASVAVNAPLTGTGTIGDPITLSGSVAGTNLNVESVGSGITIAKNTGSYGTGPLNFSAGDKLKINVQSIPNGLNWEGAHNTATAYQLNDVVFKLVGGVYYSYWCYNPTGAPASTPLPVAPSVSNAYWAQLGLQGPAGTSGATWYSGTTAGSGSSSSAVDGDYFLVTSGANAGAIFKKTGGTWGGTPILDITGPTGAAGAAGAKWSSGSGVPTGGVDGDFYLRSDGFVWSKNGTWSSTGINLKGANGADSTVVGPQGAKGDQGDTNVIVRLYQRTASATAPAVSITGTAVYTFSTNGISAQPSGWSSTIPTTGASYIWEIQAVASSSATTANISNANWSSPALIGAPGAQGTAGTAAGFGIPVANSLPSGSSPTVVASGPDTAKVFTFGIPAGAAGPQGPAGTAPTVIAFTVDGYGAPIILTAPGKTVFRVTLPFKATYQLSGLSVTSDLAVGTANGATLTVTGSGGGVTGGPFTSAFATVGATSGTNSSPGNSPIVFASAGGTLTFNLSAPTAAMTYIYVNLSGTRD